MPSFAENAIEFYNSLKIESSLPHGIEVLDPYENQEVKSIVRSFFTRYYSGGRERIILLGINPGRFGAGVTGITFTDPERLEQECGIPNSLEKRSELSSRFVYHVINSLGGPEKFFNRFFLSAVSPLGFIRSGKNLNYYDDRELETSLTGFILTTLRHQLDFGVRKDFAVCLGEGKNYKYLLKLNKEFGLFGEIFPLPHPRWVMQYRYKRREEYIRRYSELLNSLAE
jgi:hypothetical protein